MGAIESPREICVATTVTLSTNACLSVLRWFDSHPGYDRAFETTPCGIVDFDITTTAGFEQPHQGVKVTFPPLLIEMFVEITASDADGSQANTRIWRLWWCLVHALKGNRFLGHTVDGSRILDGAVTGLSVESAKEIGILARYAWLSLEVWKNI